jgi:hypothetical protein
MDKKKQHQLYIGYDYYKRGSVTYGFTFAFLIVYAAGFIASCSMTLNATISPEDRYYSSYWFAVFLTTFRIWSLLIVMQMILYRQTKCCGSYTSCTVFWFVLLIPFIVLDIVVVGILGSFLQTCNDPNLSNNQDNPCNSLLFCCEARVYTRSSNQCPNSVPCIPVRTAAELHASGDFLWLFSVSVVSLAFLIFFCIFPLLSITIWSQPKDDEFQPQQQQQQKRQQQEKADADASMVSEVANDVLMLDHTTTRQQHKK